MSKNWENESPPVNECGKPPQTLTVVIHDVEGHYLADGEIKVHADCGECDQRKPPSIGEIIVQINRDCGCIVPIGTYARESR